MMAPVANGYEESLTGGNVSTGVVRVGDTVRRPATASTRAVNALLTHLEARGFEHSPRYLGTDARGRQVLSWAAGSTQLELGPIGLDRLERLGRIIRRLHDATADFQPPSDAVWQVAIAPDTEDLVIHHDLARWNLVVDGDAMTIIDWDGAGPGSRLWDLAYAVHGFAVTGVDLGPDEAARRLSAMVDGYALDPAGRARLVPMLAARTRSMHDLLVRGRATGTQPWARLHDEGHADHWGPISDYLRENEARWRAVLGL